MKWTKEASKPISTDFQTPLEVCKYMCERIPDGAVTILEPSAGSGNMLLFLKEYLVTAPENFFELDPVVKFDCVVMNPPFSSKYAFGIPEGFDELGMRLGYYFLTECMKRTDYVIALMPWFTVSDSDVRLRHIKAYGLKSITALPRKTFQYARIQTCIFEMQRGWDSPTVFKCFELENTS